MKREVLNRIYGISPKFAPNTDVGYAVTAQNCDLKNMKFGALLDHILLEADTNLYNSLFYYNGSWQKGNDKYYLEWKILSNDLLIYLTSGVPQKIIGTSSADLGQDLLTKPTTTIVTTRTDLIGREVASIRNSTYKWTLSGSGTNEYYCTLASGEDPDFLSTVSEIGGVQLNDEIISTGTLGSLNEDEWAYGDNDALGFSTIYIRLSSGGDPDSEDEDYIELLGKPSYTWSKSASGTNEYACFTFTNLVNSTYRWIKSGSGTNEYYVELAAGGDPSLSEPDSVEINELISSEGTLGTLAAGEWGWGDNDTLGFNTVYVRLSGGGDPDSEANGYVKVLYDPSLAEPDDIEINNVSATEGTIGALNEDEWAYDDNDTLGFDTIYVRLSGNANPDSKTNGYVNHILDPGDVDGTINYVITTTRSVGGHVDESGPSGVSDDLVVSNAAVSITKPTISDSDVTYWNIYRTSDVLGAYLFVAQVDVSESSYVDTIADEDLGDAITTWYESDQGNEIIFNKPQVTFDGLINQQYNGMLFGWNGPTLYWCEPGYPDAWPDFYNMNFPSDIKRVFTFAGYVAVLTENGPFVVNGSHPEQMTQQEPLGKEPCIGIAACTTPRGVAYLSDSGIVLFNLVNTQVISDELFTEEWFAENVNSSTAFMEENDNQIYLFHSGGVLVVDVRSSKSIWYELDEVGYAAHKRLDNGKLYIINSSGVTELHGSTSSLTAVWQSGNLLFKTYEDKQFHELEFTGSGSITATLYVDDVEKASKALAFSKYRDRILKLPDQTRGRALQVKLEGTGIITEIMVGYS